MPKVNPVITENIHRNLVEFARENYPRFYYLSYSLVKNREAAMEVVTNVIYFSLLNGRKLQDLPPMKIWYYQLLCRYGMRSMHQRNYERKFTDNSQLYALMETIEPSATNVFKLFYLEDMTVSEIEDILHLKNPEVLGRLSLVRRELKIDSSMDEESLNRLKEIKTIYFEPELPEELGAQVEEVIKKEEESSAKQEAQSKKFRWIKPVGAVVLALLIFFLTLKAADQNPDFAENVLSLPILGNLFAPFL
jgi:hypothetical protein